jgi:hypothetical protein
VTSPRRLAALSALTVSTLLVAACGSSGEDGKSADQIVADAKAALKSASSFHLVGNVTDSSGGGGSVKFDMKVDDKNTASGHMEQGGVGFDFVNAGGKLYFRGKDLFAKFSAAAADAIGDQWVTVTGNASLESAASSVTGLSDASALADSLGSSGGPYSKSGTKTVNGQSVVAVNSKDGEMDVADSGTPYPVHFDGGSKGTMDITEYGSHFGIKAPSGALDVSALGGAASSDSSSSSASGSSKAVVDAGQVRDGVLLVAQGTITSSSGSLDDAWGVGPAVEKQLPSDISVSVQTGSTSNLPPATPTKVLLYVAETSSGNLFMVVVLDTAGTCDIGALTGNPANGSPVKKTLPSGTACNAENGLNALNS